MSNKRRRAVITGGSKGIGKAIAERFAQEKIDVYLLSSNKDNLKNTAAELKQKYSTNEIIGGNNMKLTILTNPSVLFTRLLLLSKIMYAKENVRNNILLFCEKS